MGRYVYQLVPESHKQYDCSNGHFITSPKAEAKCLQPKCTGKLTLVGKGSRGSYKAKADASADKKEAA